MNLERYVWNGPWGTFLLGADPAAVTRCVLPGPESAAAARSHPVVTEAPNGVRAHLERAVAWLSAWLNGEHPPPEEMPARPVASDFTESVWEALRTIPRGETRTYGEIAAQLGKPRAARAVGRACGCNPLPLWTPCHRVVGADGGLVGFSGGAGRETKRRLLEWERKSERAAPGGIFKSD